MKKIAFIILFFVIGINLFSQQKIKAFTEVKKGIWVFEAENAKLSKEGWKIETIKKGYTGKGYLIAVKRSMDNPTNQIIEYPFYVNDPGIFKIYFHARHDHTISHEYNDAWVKIDKGQWSKTTGGGHMQWGICALNSTFQNNGDWTVNLTKGLHTLYLSHRSDSFKLDRIIVLDKSVNQGFAYNLSLPESKQSEFELPIIKTENTGEYNIEGKYIKWFPLCFNFTGPFANASDSKPNPFLDYRLQIEFTSPTGKIFNVPGYFDGNGLDENNGNSWKVKFTPNEEGNWTWKVSMQKAKNIAVLNIEGEKINTIDGKTGQFTIAATDKNADGFYKYGRLEAINNFYLKFTEGPYFLKGGTDSPEDFLAYNGFHRKVENIKWPIRTYNKHVADWQNGDPDWGCGEGKGIIGALNYLSSQQVNSIYFLTHNIGGDGQNVWPFLEIKNPKGDSLNDNIHYDPNKLRLWDIVFSHAQKKDIFLHFVLEEGEHECHNELDNSKFGIERKLYYREIIARFGHYLALQWNISEEFDIKNEKKEESPLTVETVKQIAAYIKNIDPYKHPLTVHNNHYEGHDPFLSDKNFDLISFQYHYWGSKTELVYPDKLKERRNKILENNRQMPIGFDEFIWATNKDDDSYVPGWPMLTGSIYMRKNLLWPTYFSNAQIEYIFSESELNNDFSQYQALWKYTWNARKFFEQNLPFWKMIPMDSLASCSGMKNPNYRLQVLGLKGAVYAIYCPNTGHRLDFNLKNETGSFSVRWYNPRNGEFYGKAFTVQSGDIVKLGIPPSDLGDDWAVLLIGSGYNDTFSK